MSVHTSRRISQRETMRFRGSPFGRGISMNISSQAIGGDMAHFYQKSYQQPARTSIEAPQRSQTSVERSTTSRDRTYSRRRPLNITAPSFGNTKKVWHLLLPTTGHRDSHLEGCQCKLGPATTSILHLQDRLCRILLMNELLSQAIFTQSMQPPCKAVPKGGCFKYLYI